MKKLLMIDNYDSFTYNLVQMFMKLDFDLKVYRHDELDINVVIDNIPDYIVISPGPRNPMQAGISNDIIKIFHNIVPILGVCLGMQCINEFFNGRTLRSSIPIHGKTSNIFHRGFNLFDGVPSPFKGARYHSLIIENKILYNEKKNVLNIEAWSSDGIVMGFSHIFFPIYGLQFHPESFLTDYGFLIIKNFIKLGIIKSKS